MGLLFCVGIIYTPDTVTGGEVYKSMEQQDVPVRRSDKLAHLFAGRVQFDMWTTHQTKMIFLEIIFGGYKSFCGAINTPVLDFW